MPEAKATEIMALSAIAYAKRWGWPVLPLHSPTVRDHGVWCTCSARGKCEQVGKHPIFDCVPHGLNDATTDEKTIRAWWKKFPMANIGVRTGHMGNGSPGIVVIDVDITATKDGDADLDTLMDATDRFPHAPMSLTGGGGKHIIFEHPGPTYRVGNRAGDIRVKVRDQEFHLKCIDVRGDGGYIVAPPSLHRSGKQYLWEAASHIKTVKPPPMPYSLFNLLSRSKGERPVDGGAPEGEWPDELERVRRASKYVATMSPSISGQGGDNALWKAALAAVRGFCLSQGQAYDVLMEHYNPRCQPPWDNDRVAYKVDQAAVSGEVPLGYCYRDDLLKAMEREAKRAEQMARAADLRAQVVDEQDRGAEQPPAVTPAAPPPAQAADSDDVPTGWVAHNFILGDHTEVARVLKETLEREQGLLTYDEGFFWVYHGGTGIWRRMDILEVQGHVGRFAGNLIGQSKILKINAGDSTGVAKQLINSLCMNKRRPRFENSPRGITFNNGFLRVVTEDEANNGDVDFVPHAPEHMSRHALGVDWQPDATEPEALRRFFDVIFMDVKDDEERIAREYLIQEFIGACLCGVATRFQKSLIMAGGGGNGKSSVLALFRGLFPPNAIGQLPPHEWARPFQMASLVGILANFVDEVGQQTLTHTEKIKSVISGEPQHLDVKNGTPSSFQPIAGHIMSANTIPTPDDHSHGFWRRFVVLPMTATIDTSDRRIFDAGKSLSKNHKGAIAAWAIAGVQRLLRNRGQYTLPRGTQDAMEHWRIDSDDILRFLLGCQDFFFGDLFSGAGATGAEAYDEYRHWKSHTDEPYAAEMKLRDVYLPKATFFKRLEELKAYVTIVRGGDTNCYFGTAKLLELKRRRTEETLALSERRESAKRDGTSWPDMSAVPPAPVPELEK